MLKLIQYLTNQHPRLAEIVRFLIIGCFATMIDYIIMSIILYCFNPALYPHLYDIWFGQQNPSTTATVIGTGMGFTAGLIFNYVFSVLFVFHKKGQSRSAKGFLLFALFAFGGLVIHLIGMYLGYDCLGINEWIVKTCLTIFVLLYNYITRKLFIFRQQPNQHSTNPIKPQGQPEI